MLTVSAVSWRFFEIRPLRPNALSDRIGPKRFYLERLRIYRFPPNATQKRFLNFTGNDRFERAALFRIRGPAEPFVRPSGRQFGTFSAQGTTQSVEAQSRHLPTAAWIPSRSRVSESLDGRREARIDHQRQRQFRIRTVIVQ